MDLQLHLSNDSRVLPSVRGLVTEALRQLPLEGNFATQLEHLVLQIVRNAVEHAYPPDEEGTILLSIKEKEGKLEILIRDFGLPQDVAVLEQRLHQQVPGAKSLTDFPIPSAVDEVHWLSYGREGKAFQILKWLHEESIAETADATHLEAFHEDVPLAAEQSYEIRRLRSEEAVQVSQLMYRAYGNTYFNEDVYYPDRVASLNEQNAVQSFVAVGEDGTVVGHYALELNQPGPVAEGGQAVVDPRHRGRGLLERLKTAALEAARQLDLTGWYADAVTVHTLTQKSNATHGGHLTAVDLAIAPKTETFKNISVEQPQRVTCLLYFHWLKPPEPRVLSVPVRHREIVSKIYANLGCDVQLNEPPLTQPISSILTGHGTLVVQIDTGGAKAFLRADHIGTDTVRSIAHSKRELIERSRMEVVFVELPLHHPATAVVAEELEKEGFGFIGIAPHFSPQGDILRMAYLVEPLEREPIKTFENFGDELVNYVLAEQIRVRE